MIKLRQNLIQCIDSMRAHAMHAGVSGRHDNIMAFAGAHHHCVAAPIVLKVRALAMVEQIDEPGHKTPWRTRDHDSPRQASSPP